MPAAIVALALVGGLLQPASYDRDVQVRRYHVNGWLLEVRRDRFDGQTLCTIERGRVSYRHGVVTFRFGHAVDTANAEYRLDLGPAHAANSVAVEAAGLGARFDNTNFKNPSDGEVRIPADRLGDAHRVLIKPNDNMAHRSFELAGLSGAIEAAKGRGCDVT